MQQTLPHFRLQRSFLYLFNFVCIISAFLYFVFILIFDDLEYFIFLHTRLALLHEFSIFIIFICFWEFSIFISYLALAIGWIKYYLLLRLGLDEILRFKYPKSGIVKSIGFIWSTFDVKSSSYCKGSSSSVCSLEFKVLILEAQLLNFSI